MYILKLHVNYYKIIQPRDQAPAFHSNKLYYINDNVARNTTW